jgi:hypothetical protein
MLLNRRGLMIAATQAPQAAAGGSTTTWDTAASSASYTYSNGNKTATYAGGSGDQMVLGTSGHSGSGDWWYSVTLTATTLNTFVGLDNKPPSLGTNSFLGSGTGPGWQMSSGNILVGGAVVANAGTLASGDIATVRLKNGKLYLGKGATPTWVLGDPVAQTGGYDVSAMGTLYPAGSSGGGGSVTFAGDFTNWP